MTSIPALPPQQPTTPSTVKTSVVLPVYTTRAYAERILRYRADEIFIQAAQSCNTINAQTHELLIVGGAHDRSIYKVGLISKDADQASWAPIRVFDAASTTLGAPASHRFDASSQAWICVPMS